MRAEDIERVVLDALSQPVTSERTSYGVATSYQWRKAYSAAIAEAIARELAKDAC